MDFKSLYLPPLHGVGMEHKVILMWGALQEAFLLGA